ncbi:hypothetical protein HPB51_021482 [Rhipicephalus microplus]|uniref:SURP motif domain-containing protein n=1 Tax=Rhipicephalus microplus TaxID=6941 RepID=A0A9J6DIZ6_RHIMP|nr:hypothetical protein HPB51_021482 [Rhipicephalus microplus]
MDIAKAFGVTCSSWSMILKNKASILGALQNDTSARNETVTAAAFLDSWFWEQRANKVPLSGRILQQKALDFACDKRFEFLLPDHEYHQYYLHKKQTYLNERAQQQKQQESSVVEAASKDKLEPADNAGKTPSTGDVAERTEERYDVVGPKLENGLSVGTDDGLSRADSPFSNIDSNDTSSQPGFSTPSDSNYVKGPVSFSLKLKDSEGKDKKRLPLNASESDSEEPTEVAASAAPAAPSVAAPVEEPAKVVEKVAKDKHLDGASSEDRLSPARQLQLERKKRLAKFLSMIKDSQDAGAGGSVSATQAGQQRESSKGSSATSTPKEPSNRLEFSLRRLLFSCT